ncbi:MAG: chemotaxis protein CheA [Clostridiales bacterium]|nr:chemotaxis protein CheA [Clostridiales bacterium]
MDMSQYLEIFIEETKEHLQGLNQSLLQLEKKPDDSAVLNEIFRVAHTLKGMSGTMGFTRMARLTHDMENVLHSLRSNEIKASPKLIDLLFKCLDALENYSNKIIETSSEGTEDYNNLITALSSANKPGEPEEAVPEKKPEVAEAEKLPDVEQQESKKIALDQYDINVINKAYESGNKAFQITIALNSSCVLKAARSFIIFKTLEKYCEIIKSEPKVEDIEDEKFDYEFTVVVITKQDAELFEKELYSISEVHEVKIVPVLPQTVEETRAAEAEKAAAEEKVSASVKALDLTPVTEVEVETVQAKDESTAKKTKTGKTVRVDIERLDVLMNLVSELIIQKTRLEGLEGIERTPNYVEAIEYLERITSNLHDAVMKVRMVPVETVFNRFPRMIRDISKDVGKEVVLTMSGEETELDRTVIDEIGDPLIHLLRNAVDHGLESSEKRKQLGKPEVGNIWLRAYQDGNNVVIEVEEDGQGINTDKVKQKAIEKGLVDKQVAEGLSKKDIIDFLFMPSFSTADKISDLSGRGVGLDVVKTKITNLGGGVEVDTEKDKGSRFIIRLPLTLAIIQALMVVVGNEKYALQLSSINQIISIKPEDIQMVQKQEVILYRNNVIPIIRLKKVLDVPDVPDAVTEKTLKIVIVKKGDRLSGLVVDRIVGQQEVVQKSLGKFLSGIKIISSATILGDGNVALILDINSIVQ